MSTNGSLQRRGTPLILFRFQDVTDPWPIGQLADNFFVRSYFRQAKFSMVGRGVERVENPVGNRVSPQDILNLFRWI